MKKVIRYFKDNGFNETVKRIGIRSLSFIGLRESSSYVFNYKSNKEIYDIEISPFKYELVELRKEQSKNFESVNYYDFINADKILESENSKIFIAMDGNEIVGYVCCHFNVEHSIHKMGKWQLEENEAWIGPTYVVKEYRNKRIHKHLLLYSILMLGNHGINSFYTAINENNIASIKSFTNVGFEKIGVIKIKNRMNISKKISILDDGTNTLNTKFQNDSSLI
jgi:GNAT superfamily N-acetyltransferase